MGTARSRLVRTVKKPVETWGKAEKILDKKPVVAPRHPSTEATLNELENGMFLRQLAGCQFFAQVWRINMVVDLENLKWNTLERFGDSQGGTSG